MHPGLQLHEGLFVFKAGAAGGTDCVFNALPAALGEFIVHAADLLVLLGVALEEGAGALLLFPDLGGLPLHVLHELHLVGEAFAPELLPLVVLPLPRPQLLL